MDDQRVGRVVRSLRRRRGWLQVDLARAAGCSQNLISLIERGHLDRVSLRVVRRMLASLDALVMIEIRWRGAALDRLLDEEHASIVAALADQLRLHEWQVEVEVTYAEYGERGSIDILAFKPDAGVLLVIEVKSDIPSAESTLRKLDEKTRLAPTVAARRFGWRTRSVAKLLVVPESRTLRRRVTRHGALFISALPARNVAVRRWLRQPDGALAGLWFLTHRDGGVAIPMARSPERVRRRDSGHNNHARVA